MAAREAEHQCGGHSHGANLGHVHGPTRGTRMWMSLAVTVLFVVVEAWAGVRAHSLALLSDAGHNVSDAIALGLAAFAFWVARKPAAANRTFGYHRVAILTALFNALTLLVLAAMIAGGAVERFRHPTALSADGGALMIGVAAAAVLLNTVIAWALAGDAKHNLNSRAAYVHMAGDALSALGVVIAGVVVRTTGWTLADPLVSLLIAAFIAVTAVGIVRDASGILLENAPRGLDPEAVATAITSVSPVTGVHDLHVWTVGDGLNCLSCHIHLPGSLQLEECGIVVEEIHQRLHDEFGISHATIQAETENGACRRGADGDQLSYSLYCGLEPHLHDHGPDEHNHDEHSHDEHNHDVTTGSPAMPLGR